MDWILTIIRNIHQKFVIFIKNLSWIMQNLHLSLEARNWPICVHGGQNALDNN